MLEESPHLKARPMSFTFNKPLKKHWSNDDPIMSHFVDALIYLLPVVEDFFIPAMRQVKANVEDADLLKQLGGFCGQEGHHSRNHKAFNKHLDALGYIKLQKIEQEVGTILDCLLGKSEQRPFFAKFNIALTAGAEHYTSLIAHIVLDSPGRLLAEDSEISAMLYWHAVEECEHKSLCFDVFQAVSGSYFLRVSTYGLVSLLFLQAWLRGAFYMYAKDGIGFFSATGRLLKTLVKKGEKGEKSFLRIFVPRVLDYLRPGFHPDELDNQYLIEQWIKDYESGKDMTNINVLDYS